MGVIIYPEKIKNGDTLGITAVSMPANKDKIDLSIKNIESLGLNVIETNNVRQNGIVSSNAKTRAEELLELYKNPEVKYIIAARGGEFLMEMLPFLNEHKDIIKNNPKWIDAPMTLYRPLIQKIHSTAENPCNHLSCSTGNSSHTSSRSCHNAL